MKTDADYSFVAMPSVSEDGRIDTTIGRPYSEVCKGFTYFAENDVLFAKITPCMENGKGGREQVLDLQRFMYLDPLRASVIHTGYTSSQCFQSSAPMLRK